MSKINVNTELDQDIRLCVSERTFVVFFLFFFFAACVSGHVCLPPLLLSLAYPGAYPLEKTDELVKAV